MDVTTSERENLSFINIIFFQYVNEDNNSIDCPSDNNIPTADGIMSILYNIKHPIR